MIPYRTIEIATKLGATIELEPSDVEAFDAIARVFPGSWCKRATDLRRVDPGIVLGMFKEKGEGR